MSRCPNSLIPGDWQPYKLSASITLDKCLALCRICFNRANA